MDFFYEINISKLKVIFIIISDSKKFWLGNPWAGKRGQKGKITFEYKK